MVVFIFGCMKASNRLEISNKKAILAFKPEKVNTYTVITTKESISRYCLILNQLEQLSEQYSDIFNIYLDILFVFFFFITGFDRVKKFFIKTDLCVLFKDIAVLSFHLIADFFYK